MAKIESAYTNLVVITPGTQPTIVLNTAAAQYDFFSPRIDAFATVRLYGTVGEDIGGWTLGFIQLKYIGTDHARYRGAADRDGSLLVSSSNTIVCRDTDIGSTEVWYDSLNSGGMVGPLGTNKLAARTKIPASGFMWIVSHMWDQPFRFRSLIETNPAVRGNPNNFLHYAVAELLFCTMLVAQEPGGKFHMLKHFYWNVIWEHKFRQDSTGKVVLGTPMRLQQNVQQPPHSGNPLDHKFFGHEYALSLPVSNTISRRAPTRRPAPDWSEG